ncbi:ATP-dependent sacrificial sulfur transferase LarE [bacterium D16-51]|nr:ATP-dependent sacrificial sulfur transferase LarE [bacterium D16-59]RKI55833.1 ATP-dependent sacrificial sulfur transferase LarE [bacterium D16-51]
MGLQEKYRKLQQNLKDLGSVAIAFSGGVDSVFLLKAAHDVLGSRVLAVTACSPSFPKQEAEEAKRFCKENGIRQVTFLSGELESEEFRKNPPDRCYFCKRRIFGKVQEIARQNQIEAVADGANADDGADYRPGMKAARELGVCSPLQEAGLSKAEIRELSRKLGLFSWDKPSSACLASRFVYGEAINEKKLGMVEEAERFLSELGFCQSRVRMHGMLARIEVQKEELHKIANEKLGMQISERLKEIGFTYVALDLEGYRMGSMNETLDIRKGKENNE